MSELENLKRRIEADLVIDDAAKYREGLSEEQRKPRFAGNGLPKTVKEFTDEERDLWDVTCKPN